MIKYDLNDISGLKIKIKKPSIIFLRGDLGVGKTTLSKYIINEVLGEKKDIVSPTYTYYNKYNDIFHFDLYRLKNYDEFFAIGGEEIIDNNQGIIIIEWPDLIEKYYKSDIDIYLEKTENENERLINIVYNTK